MKNMFSPFKPGLLTAAALLALSSFASAQEAAAPAAGAAPESHSVIELILEGGPMTVGIWVCLVLTSVTMVTFIVQNIIEQRNQLT